MPILGNTPVAHMTNLDATRYYLPHQQRRQGEDDAIFSKQEFTKIERNNCERLGLEEAYHELVGPHRIVMAEARVGEAREIYLLTLPFQVISSLMECRTDSSYLGTAWTVADARILVANAFISIRSNSGSSYSMVREETR